MKVKTLLNGSDGSREYVAGDVLEGDSHHVRVLLMNDLAQPLDDQAKAIYERMENMTEDEWENDPLHSDAHWDRGEEERARLTELGDEAYADVVPAQVASSNAPEPFKDTQTCH